MNSLEHDLKMEMEKARGERRMKESEKPREVCTVCRARFPSGGQHTGNPWGVWGPSFQVCKWCLRAGKDERRRREEVSKEYPPGTHPEEFK